MTPPDESAFEEVCLRVFCKPDDFAELRALFPDARVTSCTKGEMVPDKHVFSGIREWPNTVFLVKPPADVDNVPDALNWICQQFAFLKDSISKFQGAMDLRVDFVSSTPHLHSVAFSAPQLRTLGEHGVSVHCSCWMPVHISVGQDESKTT